jgi:hypothetical protein
MTAISRFGPQKRNCSRAFTASHKVGFAGTGSDGESTESCGGRNDLIVTIRVESTTPRDTVALARHAERAGAAVVASLPSYYLPHS